MYLSSMLLINGLQRKRMVIGSTPVQQHEAPSCYFCKCACFTKNAISTPGTINCNPNFVKHIDLPETIAITTQTEISSLLTGFTLKLKEQSEELVRIELGNCSITICLQHKQPHEFLKVLF